MNKFKTNRYWLVLIFLLFSFTTINDNSKLKIAAILAHPDDETTFAVALYKFAQELHADIDVILITNGESGYKYSTLSERIYHLPLTEEKVGKKYLPFIRKQEALNGGKILGVRNYYFFEETDAGYTKSPEDVLNGGWNIASVKVRLERLIKQNQYDVIFVMLPTEENHGHHKAATILTLEVVNHFKERKPLILGSQPSTKSQNLKEYQAASEYPITKAETIPFIRIDRTQKFGFDNRLDYNIVADWVIAEHKSQGLLQMNANKIDYENFYYFDINGQDRKNEALQLFDFINNPY